MYTCENSDLASALGALSHPRRIKIFRLLSEARGSELNFSRIQAETQINDSSLIHHLREMERKWLVTRQRKGLETWYKLSPDTLRHSMDLVFEILNTRYQSACAA